MAELLSVETVYSDGYHNAFTDLVNWQGDYYLSFRTSDNHGLTPPGKIVVLRSSDLKTWHRCGAISTGGDDRDPKFIDMGDRLAVVFGTWYPRWSDRSLASTPHDLISHVSISRDGCCWSAPQQVYGVNYWLWRILPVDGKYMCSAYHYPRREDRDKRSIHLLESEDMLDWRLVCQMREGGGPGEPVLFQSAPGELSCVIRTIAPDNHSWFGRSAEPYTGWEWTDLGVMIHAPVVLNVDGSWICAGRSQIKDLPEGTVEPDSGHHTSVWSINDGKAEHLLTVPSAGDCSYCGFAFGPEGEVLMSYYSQHNWMPLPEGQPTPADVFLAKLRV